MQDVYKRQGVIGPYEYVQSNLGQLIIDCVNKKIGAYLEGGYNFCLLYTSLFMPIGSMFPLITSTYFKLEAIHASLVEAVFSVGMLIGGVLIATWGGDVYKRQILHLPIT